MHWGHGASALLSEVQSWNAAGDHTPGPCPVSRSGMANYAFRFRFDPWGLASCVSCTSVLLSAACTTPYTASFEILTALSIGYLLVVGFSLCMSYEPNMSYKSR